MFKRSQTVIGLDVGSYAVKAVALQPHGDRLTLQGFAQARIGSQEPVEVIRKVLEQLGARSRRLVSSVSGRSVIVRQVETPRLNANELKAHIAYEADKYIPFGSEEVIIDCQPLPERADETATKMQVLLVAVRRGFVEDHIVQLRNAGISPEIIDVDVFALANAYELLGPGQPNEPEAKTATALIDVGASKSNIAIVQGARLLFTREVYLAGNEITDAIVRTFNEPAENVERIKSAPGEALEALIDAAMPAFEDLANEIRLSFDYVEGQFDAQVNQVVLTGGSSQLPGIAEILGNILGRPVHVLDPLAGLDLVPSRYDVHGLDANGPALTIALGLAAHVLTFDQRGLGGANSHGWQPRQNRDGAAAPMTPKAQPSAPAEAAPSVPTPTPAFNRIMPPPEPLAVQNAPPMAFSTPLSPPPPPIHTPPAAMPISPGAGLDSLPDDEIERPGEDNPDNHRSGLLVVLDEDQEMPPSERHERGTSTGGKRPTQTLKVESFDEDDEARDKSGDLPELPKL
jgi:type IV pilus assembly protein PilM